MSSSITVSTIYVTILRNSADFQELCGPAPRTLSDGLNIQKKKEFSGAMNKLHSVHIHMVTF